jgi:hypothetical protein
MHICGLDQKVSDSFHLKPPHKFDKFKTEKLEVNFCHIPQVRDVMCYGCKEVYEAHLVDKLTVYSFAKIT